MQEEAHLDVDLLLDAGVPDGVGSQHQVIVMEPHDGNLTEIHHPSNLISDFE